MDKFKLGDRVYKPKGYKFPGTVVSIFQTTKGETRIVAEMEDNGMLHIFNESQLELQEKEPKGISYMVIPDAEKYMGGANTPVATFKNKNHAEYFGETMWEKWYIIKEIETDIFE